MRQELTVYSISVGLALAVIMGAANVYLGLKVGMTVSASIPAAVVSMLLLRVLLGRQSVLEANQAQTAASAGESLAAGIIFTMPALVLVGVWHEFDMILTTLVALAGGLLGIVLMIPMRRVFVTADTLPFPEGVACAAVLRTGQQAGDQDARQVIQGALFGFVFKALVSFVGVLKGTLEGAWLVGKSVVYLGSDLSVALLGVGMIVRLNIAALVFLGGGLGWLLTLPILSAGIASPENPVERAYAVWSQQVRYIGVGAMVVGGVVAIGQVWSGLGKAVRALLPATRTGQTETQDASQDMPLAWTGVLTLGCLVLTGSVYFLFTGASGCDPDGYHDHVRHGALLYCGGQLYRRSGWQLQQPGLGHDHHHRTGYRAAARPVWLYGHDRHAGHPGRGCGGVLYGLHSR